MSNSRTSSDKPRRTRKDNVIYADFGRREDAHSDAPRGGSVNLSGPATREPRKDHPRESAVYPGRTLTPAARRLLRASQISTDLGRIKRGRQYAKDGNVVAVEFLNGRIAGAVAGSQNEPFSTVIEVPYRSVDDLTAVTHRLISDPQGIPRAQKGIVPHEVLNVLLAGEFDAIKFHCDCPDSAVACKHAVALAEVAAMRLSERPTSLFELRGLNLDQLAREAAAHARKMSDRDGGTSNERFWEGLALPALPEVAPVPAIDDSDVDLLHQAMRQVSYNAWEQLQAVGDIEELYDHLVGRDVSEAAPPAGTPRRTPPWRPDDGF